MKRTLDWKNDAVGRLRALLKQGQSWTQRAAVSQAKAAQAYVRLLELAETRDSGQRGSIARFIASTYNGEAFTFDLFELRMVETGISDDMLVCLDALRWGKGDLHKLVPDGDRRAQAVIASFGLKWPGEPA